MSEKLFRIRRLNELAAALGPTQASPGRLNMSPSPSCWPQLAYTTGGGGEEM